MHVCIKGGKEKEREKGRGEPIVYIQVKKKKYKNYSICTQLLVKASCQFDLNSMVQCGQDIRIQAC